MNQETPSWKPTLTSDRRLVGPYPEVVDLTGGNFPKLDFSQESCLIISDDPGVKKIILPCGAVGVDYLVFSGLSALEEVIFTGKPNGLCKAYQWISIANVPSLRKAFLTGDVCSLKIEGAMSLESLDVSGCPGLDLVSIIEISSKIKVNVSGCLRLRRIVGLDADLVNSSGLAEQIQENQRNSRRDGTFYENMTFTDIDLLAELINEGVKALSREGLLPSEDGSILGRYDVEACDAQFKPYNFRILEPLELVYTGGTGETYAYVSIERLFWLDDLNLTDEQGMGHSSPEYCLKHFIQLTSSRLSHLPDVEDYSNEEIVEFLRSAVERSLENVISGLPTRISSSISPPDSQAFVQLAGEVGMSVVDGDVEQYSYIFPDSGVPADDEQLKWSAAVSIDISTALAQLARLKKFSLERASH